MGIIDLGNTQVIRHIYLLVFYAKTALLLLEAINAFIAPDFESLLVL